VVVDDDRKMLDLLVELLEQEQYDVTSTSDGRSALDLIHTSEPDIVVSDVVMPGMNGIELCRLLKQDMRTVHIPVLLISGVRKAKQYSLEGLTAGADDYLDVPFRHEEFLVKVARLTERHRVERHYRQIVEQAVDIIYTRDMQGHITSINEAGALFFGKSAMALAGTHLSDLFGAEAAARDIRTAARWHSGVPIRSIHRIKDTNGTDRYLESLATVEHDAQHKPHRVRAVMRDITEQRTTEQALKESEERYRRLVELSPEAIVVHSRGKFVYINSAAESLWGASCPEELIGKSLFDLVHPDYQELAQNRIESVEAELIPSPPCEQKFITLDGRVIDVEVRGMPFTFNGEPAVQWVITDITERKRAEEKLRTSEDGYRELFENANDIIYTHDLNGTFTSLNRAGERITGYTREEARRLKISDVLAPEYLTLARQMITQKEMGRAPTVYELEIITKDGRRVRLEVSTRIIFKNRMPTAVQGIARDLTDRKRSEEALRESQEFFHRFMNNSPAVAFMKNDEGRYVYVNEPFERVFGKKLTFLRGKTSFDWLPESTAKPTHQNDMEILATGLSQEIVETVPAADGSLHHWLVFKFPMADGEGRRFVAGVGVDITERRKAQEELAQQAEREALTHRIAQAVRHSLDPSEIFSTAVNELGAILNVDRCSLFMKDESKNRAVQVAEYHAADVTPAGKDFELPPFQRLIQALDKDGVLAFEDPAHDTRISDLYHQLLSKANVQSIMYVAIRVGDEVPAAFVLSTTRAARQWTVSDTLLARNIADQTGIAIRQAQLYQKAEATSIREALVNSLSNAIRASLSLPEVLRTATHELGRALNASRVYLHLYDPDNPMSPAQYRYLSQDCESLNSLELSYNDPLGQRLKSDPNPIVIDDALWHAEGSPEFQEHIRTQAERLNLRSLIYYPLIVNGIFRGALCINQTDRSRYWTEDELALVESVAAQLATGIAQAELFEMVARGKQEWETTFDAMSDGIFIFDRTGRLKRVNQAGAAFESTTPQELLGHRCCDILRTSTEAESCVVEKALADGGSVTIEITPERLNRPLLVTIEAVLDKAHKPIAVVCTARDLSELRKVEAVARQHQSLLTNILESARESIYAVDTQGRFKWCNTATLRGLGYKREDFIGRHLLDMICEGDREVVSQKLAAALRGEPQTCEFRYFARDGKLRYTRVDKSPLVVDGRTTGVLGIARDITEQKEERERAARADKLRALGQLASGVAHDFNNSLAAILGRAQLLHRQTRDQALLRNVEIIQTAAQDAAATVRRIQTFARKSSAREFEFVDVRNLLSDAIEITRTRWYNEARLRGLNYEVKLVAENDLPANGSASELREVFVNLIVNAVDAMPQGGCLAISCARRDDRLRLLFADTGTGMPEDVREKIFEPFFSTKGAHGTGLGLSVSHSIIERHGGTIRVESDPGRGTTFTIELPATERPACQIEELTSVLHSRPLSVLVVDDEPSVRETLADMLSALNHRVELTDSGQGALEKIRNTSFDLVFTDLAMPEMDGWDTARAVRRERAETFIVLVTGYGVGTVPPAGEPGLVDAIIGKPFDFDQVSEVIARLFVPQANLDLQPALIG
jgi:PAS domain S-box-containing protein